jgi:hypothetical protein
VVAAVVNVHVALVGSALLDVAGTFTPLQPVPVVVLAVFSVLAGTAIYALLVCRASRPDHVFTMIAWTFAVLSPASPLSIPGSDDRDSPARGAPLSPHRRAPPSPRRHRRPAADAHHTEGTLCMINAVLGDGLRKTRALRLSTARALPPSRAGPYRRRRSSSMIPQTASEVFLTVRGRT